MKNTIKLFSMVVLALSLMMAGSVSAQTTKAQKQENKAEQKHQGDLYSSVVKQAKKDAKRMEKEGWKSLGLPIFDQLVETRMKDKDCDASGKPRFIVSYQLVTSRSFTGAQSQADAVARLRIAQAIGTSVAALIDEAVANQEISAKEAETYNRHLENAKELVAQKLGHTFKTLEIYQELSNGNYRIQMCMCYDMKDAVSLTHKILLEELKKDSDINKEQLEKIMGFDKLSEHVATDMKTYDEIAD